MKRTLTLKTAIGAALLCSLMISPFASAKPFPAGIVRLFSTNVAKPGNDPSWSNLNLDGMRLRPTWSDVQGTSGVFDWSSIDTVVALATDHSKMIGLSVGAGVFAPQWVYDAGAYKYGIQDGSGLSMPLPWDAAFFASWSTFIRAMGSRYDANPTLAYIVISGLGQNVETYLAKTPADAASLTLLGGPTAWKEAAKKIIAVYAEAFPTTPFFITAAKPFDSADGLAALQDLIEWGVATYPGRFGIMNASLNAHSSTIYYPNLAVYNHHTTQPVGFQMLCSASLDPVRLGGTLDMALSQGVGLGAHFVELYQSDADNPGYQTVLAAQGMALKSNLPVQPPQNLRIVAP
ncbi:MAG: hypothetical protein H0W43_10885 [Chthoniobacterales bacterium]|jgi:hypothetical protein|nr:hypothetical protein [Chthoniobacterales bacterium]